MFLKCHHYKKEKTKEIKISHRNYKGFFLLSEKLKKYKVFLLLILKYIYIVLKINKKSFIAKITREK